VLKATITGPWRWPNVQFQDGLMAPSRTDVNRLAQQHFHPSRAALPPIPEFEGIAKLANGCDGADRPRCHHEGC
jgi:hypothetical protein